jgi:hypothetical protein
VHRSQACRDAHDVAAAREAQEELAATGSAARYYGVYSDEVGASGVYVTWAEVARLVEGAEGRKAHAVSAVFSVFAEAVEYVQAQTLARAGEAGTGYADGVSGMSAGELQPGGLRRGSVTKAALLREKLSDARLGQILTCLEGACGMTRGDGSETARASRAAGVLCTWSHVRSWGVGTRRWEISRALSVVSGCWASIQLARAPSRRYGAR